MKTSSIHNLLVALELLGHVAVAFYHIIAQIKHILQPKSIDLFSFYSSKTYVVGTQL